jgi:hypothetical protein
MNKRKLTVSEHVAEKVELAGIFIEDGAFLSAARALRGAADFLVRRHMRTINEMARADMNAQLAKRQS